MEDNLRNLRILVVHLKKEIDFFIEKLETQPSADLFVINGNGHGINEEVLRVVDERLDGLAVETPGKGE